MKCRYPTVVLVMIAAGACSDQVAPASEKLLPNSPAAQLTGAPQRAVAPASEMVSTPMGWYHRSCVNEVPNYAFVDTRTRIVRRSDGTTYQLPPCLYPGRRTRDGRLAATAPDFAGWVEFAQDSTSMGPGNQFGEIVANWTVPADPDTAYIPGLEYAAWPGLVSWGSTPTKAVIQPVLTYGYVTGRPGYTGGDFWTAAPWRCDLNQDCIIGGHMTVYHGDHLFGRVQLVPGSCSGGQCTWVTTIQDDNTTAVRVDTVRDLDNFRIAEGGVVETKSLTWCKMYPSTGVFFTNIALFDQSGQRVTPSWKDSVNAVNPYCGYHALSTESTVSLYHNAPPPPPPSVTVTGPQYGSAYSYVTVYATASGGTPPYMYSWRVNGSPYCGGGTSCSTTLGAGGTTTSFTATVTDSQLHHASATLGVYACPPGRAPCQFMTPAGGGAP